MLLTAVFCCLPYALAYHQTVQNFIDTLDTASAYRAGVCFLQDIFIGLRSVVDGSFDFSVRYIFAYAYMVVFFHNVSPHF